MNMHNVPTAKLLLSQTEEGATCQVVWLVADWAYEVASSDEVKKPEGITSTL